MHDAAPDMLKALEDIASERFSPQAGHNAFKLDAMLSQVQEIAQAAIAKAKS